MLAQLTLPTFAAHLNSTFRLQSESGPAIELELIQVQDKGSTDRFEQFSLTFRGPLHTLLPQQVYAMAHDVLGSLELFIVPVAQHDDGFRYQAVINRLHQAPAAERREP